MKIYLVAVLACAFCSFTYGQDKNLAEKLGYPKNAKLLIIHADDVGLSHAVDSATITAFEKGGINSASIMVTCPWFPEIAGYAKRHPEFDWGIHLTFTSEWKNYKWDGVSSSGDIPSLLGKDGYLCNSVEDFGKNAKPEEVEKEMRAEIEKTRAFGIKITHLDNHMGSILASPELIKIYQKLGKEYKMPVLIPMSMIQATAPQLVKYIDTVGTVIVDNFIMADAGIPTGNWKQFYDGQIRNLKPGLNEMIFHLAYDNDEMKAITIDHPDYGSAWRQRDLDYATSDGFKKILKSNNIYLVTWGDIQKIMYQQ